MIDRDGKYSNFSLISQIDGAKSQRVVLHAEYRASHEGALACNPPLSAKKGSVGLQKFAEIACSQWFFCLNLHKIVTHSG